MIKNSVFDHSAFNDVQRHDRTIFLSNEHMNAKFDTL